MQPCHCDPGGCKQGAPYPSSPRGVDDHLTQEIWQVPSARRISLPLPDGRVASDLRTDVAVLRSSLMVLQISPACQCSHWESTFRTELVFVVSAPRL